MFDFSFWSWWTPEALCSLKDRMTTKVHQCLTPSLIYNLSFLLLFLRLDLRPVSPPGWAAPAHSFNASLLSVSSSCVVVVNAAVRPLKNSGAMMNALWRRLVGTRLPLLSRPVEETRREDDRLWILTLRWAAFSKSYSGSILVMKLSIFEQ